MCWSLLGTTDGKRATDKTSAPCNMKKKRASGRLDKSLNGICKHEPGATFLKSLDSGVVRLLPAARIKPQLICRGLAQSLLEGTRTAPEPGHSPPEGVTKGNNQFHHFHVSQSNPIRQSAPGQSCAGGSFLCSVPSDGWQKAAGLFCWYFTRHHPKV